MPLVNKSLITGRLWIRESKPKTAAVELSCYMHVPHVKFQGDGCTLQCRRWTAAGF